MRLVNTDFILLIYTCTIVVINLYKFYCIIIHFMVYKSAGGSGGAVSPPGIFLNLDPLRVNLTNYFIIFCYFFIKNILENIFYDYRSNLFQILKIIMKQSTIFVNPIHKK